MSHDLIKLSVYFGERDRADRRFLSEALAEVFARHEVSTSLLFRGIEGFGIKHHLRHDRLLTLSEDLPLVAVAVDCPQCIARALQDVRGLRFDGLITLKRARSAEDLDWVG